ncbi:hypothetical protein AMEX_G21453 [Scomber scombrus]|uniref:Uncharacterized protein n=1 Tax=Scomber scombrus TaxID=13677 RepID=A0AAV1Q1I7_SCOSC
MSDHVNQTATRTQGVPTNKKQCKSAYTADNASVNYGENNSVFQKLKADNSDIIKANCMAFLNNILKIFYDVELLFQGQDGTICELYDIMFTLKTKLQQQQIDSFFGMETSTIVQQFPDQKAATIKHDFSNFYKTALNYLEKWYDFTNNNYQKNVACLALKSSFTFSQLSDAVEALQIGGKLDMDELYEE